MDVDGVEKEADDFAIKVTEKHNLSCIAKSNTMNTEIVGHSCS